MSTVTFKVSDEFDARPRDFARRSGRARSQVIREAVSMYLERGANGRRASFHELASDLAGSVAGPRDLSSNRNWMKGYGR